MVKKEKYKEFCKRIIRLLCKILFFGLLFNFVVYQLFDCRYKIRFFTALAFGLLYYAIERLIRFMSE